MLITAHSAHVLLNLFSTLLFKTSQIPQFILIHSFCADNLSFMQTMYYLNVVLILQLSFTHAIALLPLLTLFPILCLLFLIFFQDFLSLLKNGFANSCKVISFFNLTHCSFNISCNFSMHLNFFF